MDRLLKINEIKPSDMELIVRTDMKTKGWFVHFYSKKMEADGNLYKSDSIIKKYCSNDEVEKVLDEVIKWCVSVEK